ncbi:hypothetical protein DB88DRAFT_330246 [Papiliotrema laurentii]|uniref:Zn(2)-C6 fungal-type domain-containing protein n=1 Tax=Papiliotrema laurentii TaxID=5418 RepID=A0AAD9FMV3_PAPLA|nr:hypothetical protein DB88DRAFT_142626 [Papiliotrema laurentii]KAK1923055.1 hypothetical protein DB88DRAFT_330246 [Papiliotrema laurentii]
MTALSPRLAHLLIHEDRSHLLIHEDRSTGRLVMPDGTDVRDTREPRTQLPAPGISPPLSPRGYPFDPSPTSKQSHLPTILPTPRTREDRRPTQSIFSLLNDARPISPRAPSPAMPPRPTTAQVIRETPMAAYPPPHPATSHGYPHAHHAHHPQSFNARESYLSEQRRAVTAAGPSTGPSVRPDVFRRHSTHPYEYTPPPSRPGPYSSAGHLEDFSPIVGSRAPISRTTKACNACRSRKVRCDAGGTPNGEPSTCSRCRESGVECVYSGPQKKRGPCPGTVRQPNGARSRRPSHRSSVTSIATSYVTTPPSEDEAQWTTRSSYGFPPPGTEWPQAGNKPPVHPHPLRTSPTARQAPIPVLSWPGMQPAIEIDEPKVVFQDGYSMRPIGEQDKRAEMRKMSLALPPLKVALEKRESYYTP